MFNVIIYDRNSKNLNCVVAFSNMSEKDAKTIAGHMNTLNIQAAKMTGAVIKFIFKAVKNG